MLAAVGRQVGAWRRAGEEACGRLCDLAGTASPSSWLSRLEGMRGCVTALLSLLARPPDASL